MKINKVVAIPALALAAGISLAACGSVKAPAAAQAVTHTVTAPAATPKPAHTGGAAPTKPAPKVIVVPTPVYAAPAPAPALTACGTGMHGEQVSANGNTSCSFALNVEQAYVNGGYWYQAGTSEFYAYSPVTGQSYLMTSSSVGEPVVVTGGNNALVQFSY